MNSRILNKYSGMHVFYGNFCNLTNQHIQPNVMKLCSTIAVAKFILKVNLLSIMTNVIVRTANILGSKSIFPPVKYNNS
jgi:hypothetical protein